MLVNDAERIQNVFVQLAEGKTREDIAKSYGNKSHASLDQFMRRKNYKWDELRGTYVLRHAMGVTPRIQRIISEFRSVTADAKDIAARLGFKDHKEMATFMKDHGHVWSTEHHNYVPEEVKERNAHSESELPTEENHLEPSINWAEFLPLLQLLNDNRSKLYTLLDQTPTGGLAIPRYGVSGGHVSKMITIASVLEELVREYSQEKHIPQREIFEVALIQFFYRYGYGERIEKLLVSG